MADELLLKSDANGKSSCGYDRRLWQAALLSFLIGFILFPIAGYFLIRKYSFLAGITAFSGPAAGSLLLLAAVLTYSGSFKKMFQTLDMHPLPLLICLVVLPTVSLAITLSGGLVTVYWQKLAAHYNWTFGVPPTVDIAQNGNNTQVMILTVSALLLAPFYEEVLFRKALFEFIRHYCGVFLAFMLAPFDEEILFRKALSEFIRHYCGVVLAFIIAPLVFAVMHASLLQLPGLFVMALIWQFIYFFSRNLTVTMVLHLCNNIMAVGALLASRYMA